jgi:hypothetical protein
MQAAERLKHRGRMGEDVALSVVRAAHMYNLYNITIENPLILPLRKSIGIWDLLVWAYQVEMVHVARPEGLAGEAVTARSDRAMLGGGGGDCRTDVVDSSANFGFAAKTDAYRVHDAVRGLATVDLALPKDCVGAISRRGPSRGEIPEADLALRVRRSQLVMTSAIDGHAPDWMERPEIRIERGETIYERAASGRILRDRAGRPRELLQLVRFVGDMPWQVARARLMYREWALALRVLRVQLGGVLRAYALDEAVPALEPWKGKY